MFICILLILAVVVYRVSFAMFGSPSESGDWMSNFAPVAALFFCSALFLPRRHAFWIPLVALLVSDLILNFHYEVALVDGGLLLRFMAFAVIAWIGWGVRLSGPTLPKIFAGAAAGSIFFYLWTNTISWVAGAAYAKTLGGWVQALTIGLPGFPPTWVFFRNSLVSDLLFTLVFVLCWKITEKQNATTSLPTKNAIPATAEQPL